MGTKTVGKARPIKTKTVVAIYAKKAAVIAAFFVGEFSSRLRLFREAFG
jgi:cbb3-type cytochrome oxidase subunit 1